MRVGVGGYEGIGILSFKPGLCWFNGNAPKVPRTKIAKRYVILYIRHKKRDAIGVPFNKYFIESLAYFNKLDIEGQIFSRQRMVRIQRNFFVADFCYLNGDSFSILLLLHL